MRKLCRKSLTVGGETGPAKLRPLCVTVDEAADLLSIGRTKLYQLIANGQVEIIKIGKSTRITTESLDLFLKHSSQLAPGL